MNKSESLLRKWLDSEDLNFESFLSWYKEGNPQDGFRDPNEDLESLRPSFVLSLLNYIREESTYILTKSQVTCSTPSKGNHPTKYDYSTKKSSTSFREEKHFLPEKSHARRSLEGISGTPSTSSFSSGHKKQGSSSSSSSSHSRRLSNEVSLSDFIVKKKPQGKSRKRINLISQDVPPCNNPAFGTPSLPNEEEKKPSPPPTPTLVPIAVKTPKKDALKTPSVEPSPQSVVFKSQLDKLIQLYSFCLDENLVPNILVELYLILELLTVRETESSQDLASKNYFHSVHNCVYFASRILLFQWERLLQFCDRVTLRLLLDNHRLEVFVPELKSQLVLIYEEKKDKNNHSMSQKSATGDGSFQSVRFQSETDNRTNFPTAQSFQYFRKQRDLFYEILRDSEHDERSDAGKTPDTKKRMKVKVENLLTSSHPANLIHLARLFQCQLVGTCFSFLINGFTTDDTTLDTLDEMQELKLIDPIKYQRLQSRFTTPSMFGGPCPKPDFMGPQDFFRDFITSCNNHQFIEHLKTNLVGTMIELNDYSFTLQDKKDPGSLWHLEDEVFETVTTLRILGKYLGYIESLPYFCSVDNVPDDLVFTQISLRKNVTPTLDLIKILQQSIQEERLVVTIPWIVEYCSMIDPISVHLPYYQELFSMLVNIYRTFLLPGGKNTSSTSFGEKGSELNSMNKFYLSLSLGWLFENSLFPRELLVDSKEMRIKPIMKLENKRIRHPSKSEISLDNTPCVSQSLLYTSCPYLSELKSILSQFLSKDPVKLKTLNSTPVSSSPRVISSAILSSVEKVKKVNPGPQRSSLQLEMEENFFHNQPGSLRKTIEFIAERVASNCVKKVRTVLIPQEKERASHSIKEQLKNNSPDSKKKTMDQFQVDVENLARESCDKVRSHGPEWISERMKDSIAVSLKNLLAEDTSPVVLGTSIKITERKTLEIACQWIEDHVTLRYFLKDYQQEFNQLFKSNALKIEAEESSLLSSPVKEVKKTSDNTLKKPTNDALQSEEYITTSKLLISLKTDLKEMLLTSNPLHFTEESVINVLSDIQLSLTAGKDYVCTTGLRGFESFTVDWVISLITFCPTCVTSNVFDKLMEVWTKYLFCQSQIMTILCPRNMVLLGQSTQPTLTWQRLEVLLSRLLKSKILIPMALEDQCIQLLKQEWPEAILKKFASCLQGVVSVWKASNYHSRSGDDEIEFVQLMDWIVWYCSSAEDYVLDKQEFPELG